MRSLFFIYEMMKIEITEGQKKWQKRIKKQWEESKKMPRKKKKKIRKELMLDWELATFDFFDIRSKK